MVGIKEVRKDTACSVYYQGVLGQVIGADGEEIYFFGQFVAD